ncbi:MAG: MobC family plasmid mobilization relaxosome protein [Neisseriaceae bacterium]|nr:MobC family plasmid mobilization relaxosome protein [Neisseriaceae bacterium]
MSSKLISINENLFQIVNRIAKQKNKTKIDILNKIVSDWLVSNGYEDDLYESHFQIDSEFSSEYFTEEQNNKTEIIIFYTDPETKHELKKTAQKHYTSVSSYINNVIKNNIEDDKLYLSKLAMDFLNRHNNNLVALGRNLNQIAKRLNSHDYSAVNDLTMESLEELKKCIDESHSEIKRIIMVNY